MDQHEEIELSTIVKTQSDRHAAPAALRERIVWPSGRPTHRLGLNQNRKAGGSG